MSTGLAVTVLWEAIARGQNRETNEKKELRYRYSGHLKAKLVYLTTNKLVKVS